MKGGTSGGSPRPDSVGPSHPDRPGCPDGRSDLVFPTGRPHPALLRNCAARRSRAGAGRPSAAHGNQYCPATTCPEGAASARPTTADPPPSVRPTRPRPSTRPGPTTPSAARGTALGPDFCFRPHLRGSGTCPGALRFLAGSAPTASITRGHGWTTDREAGRNVALGKLTTTRDDEPSPCRGGQATAYSSGGRTPFARARITPSRITPARSRPGPPAQLAPATLRATGPLPYRPRATANSQRPTPRRRPWTRRTARPAGRPPPTTTGRPR